MVTIEIDDDVYEALQVPEAERPQAMKQELAVSLYARGILSFGKARELAAVSKREFHALLGEREIPRHYTETELDEDLAYARE
jgi:predicted HTH domain antitoxin